MPRFTWTQGALQVSIAAALVLTGAVMAAVSSGIAWGHTDLQGVPAEVQLTQLHLGFPGAPDLEWTSEDFDDADGIEQVRTAGTLVLVGIVTAFLALAVLGTSIGLRGHGMTAMGGILATIAGGLLVAGTVLFPIGIDQVVDWAQGQGLQAASVRWSGGLIVACIADGTLLLGGALGFAALRHPDVT